MVFFTRVLYAYTLGLLSVQSGVQGIFFFLKKGILSTYFFSGLEQKLGPKQMLGIVLIQHQIVRCIYLIFIAINHTMSYELIGKLIAKYETIQRKETFKTREFVIEKSEDINGKTITNYVKFQCVQDRTTMPDRFNIGDTVKVLFNIKGSKWNKDGKDNYITNLDAWRMEAVALGGDVAPSDAGAYFDMPAGDPGDTSDDLPF